MTESLREKDIEKATEHKRLLEERQRTEERLRAETETAWRTRYFDREVSRCKTAKLEGGGVHDVRRQLPLMNDYLRRVHIL